MEKSVDAFRTISEVAAELALPQHVLRFWETRFPQIRPLKRAGGRRYYRPADVLLLRSIRQLLYDEGYTIKGVQRVLKAHGAASSSSRLLGAHDGAAVMLAEAELVAETDVEPEDPGTREAAGDGGADTDERIVERPGSAAPLDLASSLGRAGLLEALACVEECERILRAVLPPR